MLAQCYADRTVVRARYIRVNLSVRDVVTKVGRDEEAVDAPANIVVTCSCNLRPPCVGTCLLWIQHTVNVEIASITHIIEPGALNWQKACGLLILFRAGKVNILMRR